MAKTVAGLYESSDKAQRAIEELVNSRFQREDISLTAVHVERRAVDRPVTAGDAAFQERVVEATATGEEPVVAKEQRVVEEVAVGKDVTERTERVSDTVRRTEVEVEDTTTDKDRVPHRG